ncbi:MAG: HEAT repeat domain-containing protein, partial [Planctomycetota bacterium]|nr:HEAT repeat domain-containing protein [Planctomycetota bacterium]
EVRGLADKLLKTADGDSTEIVLRVIAHENLNDSDRAERLYHAFKTHVKKEHYEVLSELDRPGQGFADPVVASLLIRLVGLTRHRDARKKILEAFRTGDPAYRAAAAHALGYFGDRKLLPLLEREFRRSQVKSTRNPGSTSSANKDYTDGLLRGMLHLGDSRHLPRLMSETATAAKTVAVTVLKIASGYTPPRDKHLARKRLPGMRQRHRALVRDIVEIAPKFSTELASFITSVSNPDECDVLYRLLPQLVSEQSYPSYIPVLKARSWDLRQLTLDLLMDGNPEPKNLSLIRRAITEWYEGEDRAGRTWAIANCHVLETDSRSRILLEILKSGSRWEQVAAIK